MNDTLVEPFRAEEIWRAVKAMAPLKASDINIWSEPWLHGPTGGFLTDHSINCDYTMVADLIDAPTATWKMDVLESLFDTVHVRKICVIPLAKSELSDELDGDMMGRGSIL
ncbi:hypothetical protein V6N12_010137 [Hibiscus sabdariffa]|uniref:Uncharacterized protein n=1 Tax=Hibiscus sabdariffa TaxID=183260 RepID=A0ABR2ECT6_9ROSI